MHKKSFATTLVLPGGSSNDTGLTTCLNPHLSEESSSSELTPNLNQTLKLPITVPFTIHKKPVNTKGSRKITEKILNDLLLPASLQQPEQPIISKPQQLHDAVSIQPETNVPVSAEETQPSKNMKKVYQENIRKLQDIIHDEILGLCEGRLAGEFKFSEVSKKIQKAHNQFSAYVINKKLLEFINELEGMNMLSNSSKGKYRWGEPGGAKSQKCTTLSRRSRNAKTVCKVNTESPSSPIATRTRNKQSDIPKMKQESREIASKIRTGLNSYFESKKLFKIEDIINSLYPERHEHTIKNILLVCQVLRDLERAGIISESLCPSTNRSTSRKSIEDSKPDYNVNQYVEVNLAKMELQEEPQQETFTFGPSSPLNMTQVVAQKSLPKARKRGLEDCSVDAGYPGRRQMRPNFSNSLEMSFIASRNGGFLKKEDEQPGNPDPQQRQNGSLRDIYRTFMEKYIGKGSCNIVLRNLCKELNSKPQCTSQILHILIAIGLVAKQNRGEFKWLGINSMEIPNTPRQLAELNQAAVEGEIAHTRASRKMIELFLRNKNKKLASHQIVSMNSDYKTHEGVCIIQSILPVFLEIGLLERTEDKKPYLYCWGGPRVVYAKLEELRKKPM